VSSEPIDLEASFARTSRAVRTSLEAVLNGAELSVAEAVALCNVTSADLRALAATADELRRQQVGDRVGYVVNRNINFTNVCVKACRFCAFSRTGRSEEGYFLEVEEVVRRAREAVEMGASEVCIQAGLPPRPPKTIYLDLLRALRAELPRLHIHAFSPEEVKYGAELMGLPVREYLAELRAAGLGSVPGTSAEILDDKVRKRLAGGRITTSEWIEVVRSAHALEIPTTATIMYGHIESDCARSSTRQVASPSSFRCRSCMRKRRCTSSKCSQTCARARPPTTSRASWRSRGSCSGAAFAICRRRGSRKVQAARSSCSTQVPTTSAAR